MFSVVFDNCGRIILYYYLGRCVIVGGNVPRWRMSRLLSGIIMSRLLSGAISRGWRDKTRGQESSQQIGVWWHDTLCVLTLTRHQCSPLNCNWNILEHSSVTGKWGHWASSSQCSHHQLPPLPLPLPACCSESLAADLHWLTDPL